LTKESSSTKSEPEQRLDYVWAGTPFKTHGVMVHQSQLSFTWIAFKADMKSLTVPFSDHFGVVTDLTLYKSVR
jgi:endonuclease/exonuclease/phosphatase family metal-dependent hydrolase